MKPFLAVSRWAGPMAACLLTACAQTGQLPPPSVAAAVADKPLPKVLAQKPGTPRPVPLPNIELTEPLLFRLMLAEVAVQRGQQLVAVQAYLELARETRDPRIARRGTEIAWRTRLLPQATELATLWLEADPGSRRAQQSVIALLITQSRLDDALPHLQRWLTRDPSAVGKGFLQLSSSINGAGDKPGVLSLMRRLADPYPAVPEAHMAVAQAAWNAGEPEEALTRARRALQLRADWELAALFVARGLQRESTDRALTFLADFINAHPEARDARLNYARMLVTEKQFRIAREQFAVLLKQAPDNLEIAQAVAGLSMQIRDYRAAESQYRRVLELNPRNPDQIRLNLGQVSERLSDFEGARRWYVSVTHGPLYMTAVSRFAGTLAKQGQVDEARRYLQGIKAVDSRQRTQLTLAEATVLREANAFKEAFDFLDVAVGKFPGNVDLLYDHAMAAEKVDRLDVLEASLRKVIALQPSHAHAHNALGYTLADRNLRLPEAKGLIEAAHKLAPDDPFILDSLGWVHFRLGDLVQARRYLELAYAQRPDAEIAAHLGEVLWAAGLHALARQRWQEGLREQPDNEALLATIRRLAPAMLQAGS
jgi:tetratricopeptide (TPR) repeat protein